MSITASFGLSIIQRGGLPPEFWLKCTEIVLDKAKQAGHNRCLPLKTQE